MGVHNVEMYPAIRKMLDMSEDEPFFIFRAQDKNSPAVLVVYETACRGSECEDVVMRRIAEARIEFNVWQHKHPDRVKTPD
jgi:hypothetical protein